jgi:ferric-dicitrate binding protein FerR (iron transport regulator)
MKEEPKENYSMQEADRIAYLIAGHITNTLTEAEKDELDEWVTVNDENMRLFAELTDEKNIIKGLKERRLYDADKATAKLHVVIDSRRHARKVRLYTIGLAACLILMAGLFLVVPMLIKRARMQAPAAKLATRDLLPGANKAVLTTADGKQIVLDTVSGAVLQQGDYRVMNANGILNYQGQDSHADYHTLTVPRGGQYQVVLADGSKVWLNAGSSLTYPTRFTGNERKVRATGEVYFAVTHDASRPFRVGVDDMTIEVLGTEFDVNAYKDDGTIKTTLLKGSVKITEGHKTVKIKPGEQAVRAMQGELSVTDSIDREEITGWKEGVFAFRDEPIEKIMQQVARWYNVDIKYEGKVDHHFNATIDRHVPVSKLLHLLELTNRVHFTVSDKEIIVKP